MMEKSAQPGERGGGARPPPYIYNHVQRCGVECTVELLPDTVNKRSWWS